MDNLINYVKENGYKTFKELKFNEVDAAQPPFTLSANCFLVIETSSCTTEVEELHPAHSTTKAQIIKVTFFIFINFTIVIQLLL